MVTRLRATLAATLLGAVALIGAVACTPGTGTGETMSPEATALVAAGFPSDDVIPAANPSASPGATAPAHPRARRLALRRALRGKVEHGEVVVKTKDGDKTVEIQRGTVTAIDSHTVTVKSADGFSLTWTIGTPIHVIEHRTSVQPSAVTAGAQVGVAGTKSGGTVTATLIVIPAAK
jgi:hypothetical protein